MAYRVDLSDLAEAELKTHVSALAENSIVSASKLLEHASQAMLRLETLPLIGQLYSEPYRQIVIGSYLILYRVHEAQKWVTILSIRHTAQDRARILELLHARDNS